ncbi:hypothetical protein DPM19_21985 [Actinomadura craniellae]|uniref:Terpene synthase n=1 Tax=Actinomadura craniellae TaxID=2231787 RepID=A0A365H2E6_9ACTN|nr:hypothetical protein [Actinomadura craniellae]RAY13162.1 hypothetical protein DPM19_21985 [Actinomadura craniellae]
MDASLLSLADRVAALATPSAVHPAADQIGERVEAWARDQGLVLGDRDTSPLARGRFDRLAVRLFPESAPERVELVARWLVWVFAFDDALDDGPLGGSATAVDGLYADLLRAMRRGHARPEGRPLELAVVGLWHDTAPQMSLTWRRRFFEHMEDHRSGCAEEAVNRRTGRIPALNRYPGLRRRAAAPFLFDLAEPALGVELPSDVVAVPAWHTVLNGTADLITWCNDVVSYPKEAGHGDIHNHVVLARGMYGFDRHEATGWVLDAIVHRAAEIEAAVRTLHAGLERLRLEPQRRAGVTAVLDRLLAAPRAHFDWLMESGRYTSLS